MAELVSISIDGRIYKVNSDKNLLETCLSLGIDLGYFCWHPSMGSVGSCRQCAVVQFQDESDTRGRLVMACMTPVSQNMFVSVNDDKAKTFRATAIEAIMTNHPHDCPVCEEGGDCHLQDMTLMSGHISRRYVGTKRTHNNQDLGPLINHEMNRCIGCYRCVRFYRNYCNEDDLNVFGSRNNIYFGRAEPGILASNFSGNLAEVCPTGVFTDKTFSEHYCRKWDLASSPTICQHCSLGCNTYTGSYNKLVRKITNRHNSAINGDFLCDKGRFSYQYANNEQRPARALLRNIDLKQSQPLCITDANGVFKQWLGQANGSIAALGSSRSSIENNVALIRLLDEQGAGVSDFYADCSDHELGLQQHQIGHYQQNQLTPCSLSELESADCALVIGEDVCNIAPRLALCLRQMVRNEGIANAAKIGIAPWQDQAVRNLTQDLKSPLFIVSHADSKLQDIARSHQLLDLEQQAILLTHVRDHLLHQTATAGSFTGTFAENILAGQIASELAQAKRPVIVYGSSYSNTEIQLLVNDIYLILSERNSHSMFHYLVEGANSQALAVISPKENGLDALLSRLTKTPPKMLLILEADLDWLYSGPRAKELYQQCFEQIEHVVVIDHLMTGTAEMADLLLPAASATEQQGIWLNSQGRLQLSLASIPAADSRRPGWQWCTDNGQDHEQNSYNALLQWCSDKFSLLGPVTDFVHQQDSQFKLARKSFRASGRTAINADVDVKEYPPARDNLSDFEFSMEGVAPFRQQNSDVKTASGAYIWQPKWNSDQGANKHDPVTHNTLNEGGSESRLIFPGKISQPFVPPADSPEHADRPQPDTSSAPHADSDQMLRLMPLTSFYDSNELSRYCPSLTGLMTGNIVKLNQACADLLNWQAGEFCTIHLNSHHIRVHCQIDEHCPDRWVLISVEGYKTLGLNNRHCLVSSQHLTARTIR